MTLEFEKVNLIFLLFFTCHAHGLFIEILRGFETFCYLVIRQQTKSTKRQKTAAEQKRTNGQEKKHGAQPTVDGKT